LGVKRVARMPEAVLDRFGPYSAMGESEPGEVDGLTVVWWVIQEG